MRTQMSVSLRDARFALAQVSWVVAMAVSLMKGAGVRSWVPLGV